MEEIINREAAAVELADGCYHWSSRDMKPASLTKSNLHPVFYNDLFPKADEAFRYERRSDTMKVIPDKYLEFSNKRQGAFVHEMENDSKRDIINVKVSRECSKKSTKPRGRPKNNQQTSRNTNPAVACAEQKVFLGGLPLGMKEKTLRNELAALGYKVLKRPKMLRGFAPEVTMSSVAEAKELVAKGTINLNGFKVEVRSFNSNNKRSKSRNIPNVKKRSVFLGGLSIGTKAKDILDVIKKFNVRIVNYPVVKFGFSPQIILQSISQAQKLIKMKNVLINGKIVEVKPFADHQSRKRLY